MPGFLRLARAALTIAALFGAPVVQADPDFEWPDWAALRARYPDAGAVRLLHETTTKITELGQEDLGKRVTERVVVAILDPAAAGAWLEWTVPDAEGQVLRNLEARTWLSPSRHEDVTRNQIFTVSMFPDYLLYADIKGKRFTFPAVARETVVELRYEYTSPWRFSVEHVFAAGIPTLVSRARLVVPTDYLDVGFEQNVRAFRLHATPQSRPFIAPDGDMREFVWELRDLDALPIEPDMPPVSEIAPSVRVSPKPPRWSKRGWNALGRDYYSITFERSRESTRETRELAARLTAGAATVEDKIQAIYRFVQSQIRYVAVELGIGGIQPHAAGEILRLRYGDCKDKVCLMLSLLHDAGIEGEPALVRTQQTGEVDSVLLDLGQFNHVIACVPAGNELRWLDPTSEFCSSEYLPSDDQGTLALVVGPELARLVRTPIYPAKASAVVRSLDARIEANGALSGKLGLEATGELGAGYRAAIAARSGEQRRLLAADLLTRQLPGARLQGFHVVRLDSLEQPLGLELDFDCSRCGTQMGDAVVLPSDFLKPPSDEEAFQAEKRVHPILYDCLERWEDRVRIAPPSGYRIELPSWSSVPGKFHSLYVDSRESDGAALLNRVLERKALVVRPAEFPAAREEFQQIEAALAEPFRFARAP